MEDIIEISIILPTYNERENIIDLAAAINEQVTGKKEIIVVDDSSPDGTSQIVQQSIDAGSTPNLRLITRTKNPGLTNSIRDGIENSRGKIVVWLDSDFSMPPEDIPKLLAKITEGYDVAVGSRFVEGGSFKRDTSGSEDSWIAVLLSRIMNLFIRFILGYSFKDYTSGFIAIKKDVLKRIELKGDYGEYFIDLMFRVFLLGYKVVEVPYICMPRRRGYSKTGSNMKDYMVRGRKYIVLTLNLFMVKLLNKFFRFV